MEFSYDKMRVIAVDLQNAYLGDDWPLINAILAFFATVRAHHILCDITLIDLQHSDPTAALFAPYHRRWPRRHFNRDAMAKFVREFNIPEAAQLAAPFAAMDDVLFIGKGERDLFSDNYGAKIATAEDDVHIIFGQKYDQCAYATALGSKRVKEKRTVIFVRDLSTKTALAELGDYDAIDEKLRAAGIIVVDSDQLDFGPKRMTILPTPSKPRPDNTSDGDKPRND